MVISVLVITDHLAIRDILAIAFVTLTVANRGNAGQVGIFILQVFPDIFHPDIPLPPLLLFLSACRCKAAFGSLFSSIRSTCPNHGWKTRLPSQRRPKRLWPSQQSRSPIISSHTGNLGLL